MFLHTEKGRLGGGPHRAVRDCQNTRRMQMMGTCEMVWRMNIAIIMCVSMNVLTVVKTNRRVPSFYLTFPQKKMAYHYLSKTVSSTFFCSLFYDTFGLGISTVSPSVEYMLPPNRPTGLSFMVSTAGFKGS